MVIISPTLCLLAQFSILTYTGESCCGQRALYPLGMSGIPIYNVNNNCSTGSSALLLAQQLVSGGVAECVLAVGFEKMKRGSLTGKVPTFLQVIHSYYYYVDIL